MTNEAKAGTGYSTTERSTVVRAAPSRILPLLTDFTRWPEWSPWEGAEQEMKRTYAGEQGTVGAHYTWDGNRKAGAGSMAVTEITPGTVKIDLTFTRPFRSSSKVVFTLTSPGDAAGSEATKVVWTMLSPKTRITKVVGLFVNMDKMLANDFDRGLASLRTLAERE